MANKQRTYIMWLLKVKSVATGKYQTLEISGDLTALLREADRLVARGIKIQIVDEKRAYQARLHDSSI